MTTDTVESVLRSASRDRGCHDQHAYEFWKREIVRLGLSPVEYEDAIYKLSKILGV